MFYKDETLYISRYTLLIYMSDCFHICTGQYTILPAIGLFIYAGYTIYHGRAICYPYVCDASGPRTQYKHYDLDTISIQRTSFILHLLFNFIKWVEQLLNILETELR